MRHGGPEERQRREIAVKEIVPRLRPRPTKGLPCFAGKHELLIRDRALEALEGGKAVGRLPAQKVRGLHQEQRALVKPVMVEPIEDLEKLQLIVEIVLEPQGDPAEGGGMGKPTITGLETVGELAHLSPASAR